MQIKTRVAGVLATSAAAIAIMGGPAFASNNPVVGTPRPCWMTAETSTAVLPGAGPQGARRLLS